MADDDLYSLGDSVEEHDGGVAHHSAHHAPPAVSQQDDGDEYSEDEDLAAPPTPAADVPAAVDSSHRRQQQQEQQPVISLKGITLTSAQAKLYGLGDVASSTSSLLFDVLRQTRAHGGGGGGASSRGGGAPSADRLDALATPVKHATASASAPEDCPFTWRRSRRAEAAARDPACGYDFIRRGDDDADANGGDREGAFLSRMDAQTTHARRRLAERRAEEEYNARLDKKCCPQCGAVQSYDEHSKKKEACGACNRPYRAGTSWSRAAWDARNAAVAAKSEARLAALRAAVDAETRGLAPSSGGGGGAVHKQSRTQAALKARAGGGAGFMTRMEGDVARRAREAEARRAAAAAVDRAAFAPRLSTAGATANAAAAAAAAVAGGGGDGAQRPSRPETAGPRLSAGVARAVAGGGGGGGGRRGSSGSAAGVGLDKGKLRTLVQA